MMAPPALPMFLTEPHVTARQWQGAKQRPTQFNSRKNSPRKPVEDLPKWRKEIPIVRPGYYIGTCSGCTEVKELILETDWCDGCIGGFAKVGEGNSYG